MSVVQVFTLEKLVMNPVVEHFFDPFTFTFSYVVFDEESQDAVIIDPVLDYDTASGEISYQSANKLLAFVKQKQLTVEWILETHAHADHITAAQYLREELSAKVAIGQGIVKAQKHFAEVFNLDTDFATDGRQFDYRFTDNETFKLGSIDCKVIATPGHTDDSMTYLIGDAAFIGDTMFHPQVGTARCDFPGGDAKTLYQSIQKILSLPADTRLFLCHDYPTIDRLPIYQVSIEQQRQKNIHVSQQATERDFIAFRQERDGMLAAPKLIYPSIQINIAAGKLPSAESNQCQYLKIPLTVKKD